MMVVDTSALLAIALADDAGPSCLEALRREPRLLISAGTIVECLIVARHRRVADIVTALLDGLMFDVVTVTNASARRCASAHARWGKGNHTAGLNYGDCFAYEVAKHHDCALLYVGNDFAKTDVMSAL